MPVLLHPFPSSSKFLSCENPHLWEHIGGCRNQQVGSWDPSTDKRTEHVPSLKSGPAVHHYYSKLLTLNPCFLENP